MTQLMDLYLKAINEDSSLRFDAEKRIDEVRKCDEALKGKQHKLDVDKDGKIEGEDLAKLRAMKEEEELNLEDFSLEELQDFMVSEDFEQLDELSKETLGKYIKKSSQYRGYHGMDAGAAGYRSKDQKDAIDKMGRRQRGVEKAVGKLTKESIEATVSEDFEQLDELSKKTLGKYIKKAAFRVGIHGMNAGEAKVGSKENKVANDKMGKRYMGILKAADKLTKEETEQLDELSNKTLKSYLNNTSDNSTHHRIVKLDPEVGMDRKNRNRVQDNQDRGRDQARDRIKARETGSEHLDVPYSYSAQGKKYNNELSALKRKHGITEETELEEMTKAQMDKREDYVKGMKKNYKDFVSKYGTRAKDVMYATATKMAMKEEVEHDKEAYRKEAFKKDSNGKCLASNNRACYMLGANAEYRGLSHKHNPYKTGTSSHKHWANGLEDAVKGNLKPPVNEEIEFDEDLNLEDYSLEELQDFMMSEDFEQLDEISKQVLGSYVKKASTDYAHNRLKGDDETAEKRRAGVKAAKIKLHKGEDDGKAGITEGQKIKTATGYIHKGSYGSEYDTDEDGSEKKKDEPEVKRGRGRPRKGADSNGNVKKYAVSSLLNRLMK